MFFQRSFGAVIPWLFKFLKFNVSSSHGEIASLLYDHAEIVKLSIWG